MVSETPSGSLRPRRQERGHIAANSTSTVLKLCAVVVTGRPTPATHLITMRSDVTSDLLILEVDVC